MVIVFDAYLIQYPEIFYYRDFGEDRLRICQEFGLRYRAFVVFQDKDHHVLNGG